jgi:osmotically-inducible protein OsmY
MGKTKDVRAAVEAELGFDPRVEATGITVKNVNGEVALNGTVPSYPQYLEAAAAARRVAGVTSVHNHLEVLLPPGDYRDDAMLTTAANNALTLNVTVPPGIEATAGDGNLQLIGTVSYRSERAAAERAVAELTGVRNIKDDIDIDPGVDPTNILYLVQEVLDRYAVVDDDSNVEVTTSGTTVTLTGNVRTWAEHDAVVDAAWMAGGIVDVRDELSVTG